MFGPFLALSACTAPPAATTTLQPGEPHVLVVIMDGVRVEEVTSDWTSDVTGQTGEAFADDIWAQLAPDGTVVRSILNPVLTSTAPGHAAIVTGRPEPVLTVGIQEARGAELYRPDVPTLFEVTRESLGWAEEDAVLLANSVVMQAVNQSIYPGLEGFGGTWVEVTEPLNPQIIEDDDTRTVGIVEDSLRAAPPPLFVVNLHDADRTAHAGVDAGYPERVQEQDDEIAAMWAWLRDRQPDYVDGLLMVVTADHGRHRHDLDGGWTNHGDSCTGCREVPLILLGEGVAAGVIAEGSYSLLDIAPTLAAHLGVDLPWAQGLPLAPLVDGVGGGRSGDIAVSSSGGRLAVQGWLDDFTARSEIRVDGEPVSTPGVYAAEAPALLVGTGGSYVCFRELSTTAVEDALPWTPRCLVDQGAGWVDIGFPDTAVGPFWSATLSEIDGELWAAWLHTPLTRGADGSDGLRLSRWSPSEGWDTPDGPGSVLTTLDVTMTPTTSGFLLSATVNLADPQEPYTRQIAVWPFDTRGRELRGDVRFTLEELLPEPRRVEHSALAADGDHARIAMLAIGEDTRFVAWSESTDGGATWGAPAALPTEGELFVHLGPQWDGDYAVWATRLDDGSAALCRAAPADTAADCVPTGSPRIDSFDVQGGTAVVSVDGGVGAWETGTLHW